MYRTRTCTDRRRTRCPKAYRSAPGTASGRGRAPPEVPPGRPLPTLGQADRGQARGPCIGREIHHLQWFRKTTQVLEEHQAAGQRHRQPIKGDEVLQLPHGAQDRDPTVASTVHYAPQHGVQVQGLGDADTGSAHAGAHLACMCRVFGFRLRGLVQGCTLPVAPAASRYGMPTASTDRM